MPGKVKLHSFPPVVCSEKKLLKAVKYQMKTIIRRALSPVRDQIAKILKLRKCDAIDNLPENPLGSAVGHSPEYFDSLAVGARSRIFSEVESFEKATGFSVDQEWLDHLAFRTQIVIKDAELNYQHGKIVYSSLRSYLSAQSSNEPVYVFETGTARGFSAVCMSRALSDSGRVGVITSVDILPHDVPMYWNCIDDLDGRKSRRELLSPWSELLKSIVFVQLETMTAVNRISFPRIHFDASHTFEDVCSEFDFVQSRQEVGDVIVFDDVTPTEFPGVVKAVEKIALDGVYNVQKIEADGCRGYAIATRLR